MHQRADASSGPVAAGIYGAAMADAVRRHLPLHAVAALSLLAAAGIGMRTGNYPDAHVLGDFGFYILVALWIGGCTAATARLLWLGIVKREASPLGAFVRSGRDFFLDPDRLANTLNGLAAAVMFFTAFGVMKGAIAILSPFAWDEALMRLDRAMHFGRLPHEYLWWIYDMPLVVQALNFAYHLWFVLLLATVFAAVVAKRDSRLRLQFLMSFMAMWLVGGFLVAMAFSSAGPCYYERIGLGDTYAPLMEALRTVDASHTLWALSTQDVLWNGYAGVAEGSMGISAFPSMHVAMATLIAIYFTRRWLPLGVCAWVFAGTVMLGSVVLGWHYAIDGYAGAAIAALAWFLTGRWIDARQARAAALTAS